MAATALSTGGIALHGAPDFDIGSKDAKAPSLQAMQLDIAQDIIDELLDSVSSGKVPQMIFGRTPVRLLSLSQLVLGALRFMSCPCLLMFVHVSWSCSGSCQKVLVMPP